MMKRKTKGGKMEIIWESGGPGKRQTLVCREKKEVRKVLCILLKEIISIYLHKITLKLLLKQKTKTSAILLL